MGDAVWDDRAPNRSHPPAPPAVPPITVGVPIRVTDERDGIIRPRQMSDRANAYLQDGHAIVFCGTSEGPRFFWVDLASGHVERLGQLVPYGGETDGWLWLRSGHVVLPVGPRLVAVNPFDLGDGRVLLDISDSHPEHDLWQPSSSDDGQVQAATVRQIVASGQYPYVGTIIQSLHGRQFIAARGELDESQVDRTGTYCVIKENVTGVEVNRIITIATCAERWITHDEGRIGHSDCGPGFIVGEANRPEPGRCVKMDLDTLERTDLFLSWNMGYVSVRGGQCLWSNETHLSLVALDGSGVTPLIEHGGGSAYDDRVKANLDPTGRIATYMTGRPDVYLVGMP